MHTGGWDPLVAADLANQPTRPVGVGCICQVWLKLVAAGTRSRPTSAANWAGPKAAIRASVPQDVELSLVVLAWAWHIVNAGPQAIVAGGKFGDFAPCVIF